MSLNNRQNFLFQRGANHFIKYLVPTHASRAEVHKDETGYWINVWWHCGVIAPLTVQETAQALGENNVEGPGISNADWN